MIAVDIAQRTSRTSEASQSEALTVFSFMWAATQLLDLLCFPAWLVEPTGVAAFLSALAVLIKPAAFNRLLLMCSISLVQLYVRSPITANHIFFEGFVNLTILIVALRQRVRGDAAPAAIFEEARPVLRALVVTLYALGCLHKLNWDFLTPATSCAGFMLDGIAGRFGTVVPGGMAVKTAGMWATLAVEGGIPLLLLFPRTRRLALLIAWPFHSGLAFHPRPGLYGFASMLFAMLTLFLPPDFYARLRERPFVARITDVASARNLRLTGWLVVGVAMAALVAGLLAPAALDLSRATPAGWVRRIGMLVWMPYALLVLFALLVGWRDAQGHASAGFLMNARRSPAVAVLLLFIVNGLAPYLGFQTVRTMSMFSNVRTEGGRTNHLFMPSSLQIAGFQDDLVRPIASSDIWLDFYANNQSLLPFTELRRRAWEHPDVPLQVTYERGGRIETLDTSKPRAAQLVPPLPFPLEKVLAFREVDQDGAPVRCLW